jgi:hypothetical protein
MVCYMLIVLQQQQQRVRQQSSPIASEDASSNRDELVHSVDEGSGSSTVVPAKRKVENMNVYRAAVFCPILKFPRKKIGPQTTLF